MTELPVKGLAEPCTVEEVHVNPEYFECILFSYTSYAAAFIRNFHAYESDATVSFALKISDCTKISCVQNVGGPPKKENLVRTK